MNPCAVDGCPMFVPDERLTCMDHGLRPNPDWEAAVAMSAEDRRKLRAEVERLTAERDSLQATIDLCGCQTADPEAPPIPCVRVDDTDGRPTWEAPGRAVRTLGDEWERRIMGGPGVGSYDPYPWDREPHDSLPCLTYLIRRTLPPAPRTERVPWGVELVGRTVPDGREVVAVGFRAGNPMPWFTVNDFARQESADDFTCADGTVEVLTQDGDR